ncbi:MAG: S8 family serine peptidase [Phreatobacter sp.]|uniref:S8 family serine peptidase n=1 Tax=Phreatobacter sp. TaxID=1966341 RepID=UPI004036B314
MADQINRRAPDWYVLLPGLGDLHQRTLGDPNVRIAVLDGPVRRGEVPSGAAAVAMQHGTAIVSILAGSPDGAVEGLAPRCQVVVTDIYVAATAKGVQPTCSHKDLARHIADAIKAGAHVINISAAQPLDPSLASAELASAMVEAERRDVLVVAAAGNDGCSCDALPAAMPAVLAVGAHDSAGLPLPMSNWGLGTRAQGILAPGSGIPGSCLEGGLCQFEGTSFAAAIVSGVAALLMSLDASNGISPSAARVRRILKSSADPCDPGANERCGPFLLGRLNVGRAVQMLKDHKPPLPKEATMTTPELHTKPIVLESPALVPAGVDAGGTPAPLAAPNGVAPACGCGGKCGGGAACTCGDKAKSSPQLAYAIGRIGVSFPSLARRDALWRAVNGGREGDLKPISNAALLDLFGKQAFQAQSVVWTLSRTEVPMYAIVPSGAFAAETYRWLVEEWADADVEFASIPGLIAGQTTLYDGSVVDVLVPDLRGMNSWSVSAYTKAILDERKKAEPKATDAALKQDLSRFFGKILFSIRNKGVTPQERALNAAATNAFNFSDVLRDAGREGMTLRDVAVERSPINRVGGEYYDVLLTFFDPKRRTEVAPLLARFTIDVADTVPVLIGDPTIWYEY